MWINTYSFYPDMFGLDSGRDRSFDNTKQKRMMKRLLFIFSTCLFLCACGTKQEAKQTPYTEEEYVIRGSVLQNPDSMEYYSKLAAEGDARGLYVMAASYYCNGQVQPLPVGITRVRSKEVADSMLTVASEQGYKPAISTIECFRNCGEWEKE